MTDNEILSDRSLTYDHPYYYWRGERFAPNIFDAGPSEKVPAGFNSVRVRLDGGVRSDLNWDSILATAEGYMQEGFKILWDLDLGLFSRLESPLTDTAQREALRLTVRHFCDVVWPRFSEVTLGVVFYRGSIDFSRFFPWDSDQRDAFTQQAEGKESASALRLFCRDLCANYLTQLTAGLPGDLHPCVVIDATPVSDAGHALQLLHRECWDRFIMIAKGAPNSTLGMGWDDPTSPLGYLGRQAITLPELEHPTIGFCLPGIHYEGSEVAQALHRLDLQEIPYRIVTEDYLTADWDGLDLLVVISSGIAADTLRKLRGFCAAGGCVAVVGELLGLANEVSFFEP